MVWLEAALPPRTRLTVHLGDAGPDTRFMAAFSETMICGQPVPPCTPRWGCAERAAALRGVHTQPGARPPPCCSPALRQRFRFRVPVRLQDSGLAEPSDARTLRRERLGLFWGSGVRVALGLQRALKGSLVSKSGGYDLTLGEGPSRRRART
jgi:hypothetical protein